LKILLRKPLHGIRHISKTFLQKKRRRILARLNGVQQAITISPTSSLLQLESNLQLEFNQVLDQEHELWAFKSQINWTI